MAPADRMVLVNVTVNSLQLIVQVSYKIFIILRFTYSLFVVLAFCNPNITCNGQGNCGDDGRCQCLDGLFGENCSGKLANCMSFPSKPYFFQKNNKNLPTILFYD